MARALPETIDAGAPEMPLRDPFAAYNAANNMEAHFVCELLLAAGIEAVVVEDLSLAGGWIGGWMPEIHKPQVVDRTRRPRAGQTRTR